MMKFLKLSLLTYLFLFYIIAANAGQNANKINDTVSINTLIKTGEKHLTEDADTAIIILKNAMILSSDMKFESGYLRSGFLLSKVYKHKGLFYDAIKTIDYLLKYSEKNKNKDLKGKCFYALGEINRAAFYTDKALNFLFESLAIFKEMQNLPEQAKCFNRISAVYFEKKDLNKAEAYADSSNFIAIPLNKYLLISSNEELLGAVYRRTQRYKPAIKKLENALKLTMLSGDSTDIPNILNNFAYTYLEQKDFDKAIEYADKSFKISVKKDILVYTSNAAQILSDCYRAKNQLEKAYNFLRFRDSLSYKSLMNDRNKIIMDLNEKYEAGKKEKERILLQKDNELKSATIKSQKYLSGLMLLVLIIVTAGAIVIYKGRQKLLKANIQLEIKKEKILKQHLQISEAFEKLKELESFKESMTGMIVHDLKNPINTIINPASYLNTTQKLESNRHAGYQMLNLVTNILDVQKYETQKIVLNCAKCSLSKIISDAINQVEILSSQKNLKISVEIKKHLTVFADKDIMIRIFVNLLTNAVKFSPNNGVIKIFDDSQPDFLNILVEDDGDGIPQDKQNFVFDKFSQVIAKKSGIARSTGLGLAFCKLAIEAHEGFISVSNKTGSGSIFKITLPMNKYEYSNDLIINDPQLKKNVELIFSEDEKLILLSIIKQLKNIEVYEITRIRKILNDASQNSTPVLTKWTERINSAIYSGNDKLYHKLLNLYS